MMNDDDSVIERIVVHCRRSGDRGCLGRRYLRRGEIISGNFFFCFPFSVEWSGVECGGMGEERERGGGRKKEMEMFLL